MLDANIAAAQYDDSGDCWVGQSALECGAADSSCCSCENDLHDDRINIDDGETDAKAQGCCFFTT